MSGTIRRLLLAIDDSPDSLAATRLALRLALDLGARLNVLHVLRDHQFSAAIAVASGRPLTDVKAGLVGQSLTARVATRAAQIGVPCETTVLTGEVAPTILAVAQDWGADLLVLGKSARAATGEPYVGSQARHVLEFAEQPVLIVPPARTS